jgi:hypothetical protein
MLSRIGPLIELNQLYSYDELRVLISIHHLVYNSNDIFFQIF